MLNIDALTALTNLPIATQVIILGTAHCLLGLTAPAIANQRRKLRPFPAAITFNQESKKTKL
ncbi:hypothetical protein IQE94_15220 [Synechocystis sp. PCC 7339]|uniref:hypothetical protein n=1 Tax=unclassified Synechocystis TaxID=2640012 RepID=UPI001BAE6C06|nr:MULTISPECIES: hypothetical protein [unclassified Synechocystis]QUS60150.1 hypothetical protein HTZ78_05340 [Synechocystis sp. PCC 7338]UAJ72403.1 hypothetical protein IQE94_15220 [Synechocystis sp. PCC 7339]